MADTLKNIQSLIDASNKTTGKSDTNMTSATQSLIDGYGSGTDTSDATITPSDVMSGKVGYGKNGKVVGVIKKKTTTITPTAQSQTVVPARHTLFSSVTVNGDTNLVSDNIRNGVNIFGVSGNYVAPSGYVLPNYTRTSETITPGTSSITIPAGTYCEGSQTILGDTNLLPENIKNGITIFGQTGNYSGGGDSGYDLLYKSSVGRSSVRGTYIEFDVSPKTSDPELFFCSSTNDVSNSDGGVEWFLYDNNSRDIVVCYRVYDGMIGNLEYKQNYEGVTLTSYSNGILKAEIKEDSIHPTGLQFIRNCTYISFIIYKNA